MNKCWCLELLFCIDLEEVKAQVGDYHQDLFGKLYV